MSLALINGGLRLCWSVYMYMYIISLWRIRILHYYIKIHTYFLLLMN